MDVNGNIQRFSDEAYALLQGFETLLSEQQADALAKMRHAEYLEKLKAAVYNGLQGRTARRVAKKSSVKRAHKYR